MVIRIIGAGAVGTSVAFKLKGVSDIGFIVDESRCERYSAGLKYNGEMLGVPLYTPDECSIKADLIILAVKNFQLAGAIEEIRPFVKEESIIMSLLNGLDAEEILVHEFGPEKVIYSFITDLSSNHDGLETNCFSDGGRIVFGEKNDLVTARVEMLANLFEKAGQRYTIAKNIMHEKWWKFMLNTCFNSLSAILEADYHAISNSPDFVRGVRVIAKEVQSVAKSSGVNITQDDIEDMIKHVTRITDHGKTSMLQDVLAHRDTENNYFAGAVSRLGRKNGIPTPICDFVSILVEAKRSVLYG